ncbi:unnamed protein product [Schistosoma margrebowiei]|uniref:SAP domain-containing protein n=1 Tax=Schistosoma margrebowiei TaxID=48269 RepID=A0AA85AHT3_9TREM|nr:unnamed protein product [Schistosoma margrebowiei]
MSTPEGVLLPDGRRIGDLKVADLRNQLEIRGLSRSGVKKDLCARLSDAVDGELRQMKNESGSVAKCVESEDPLGEIDAVASDEEITEVSTSADVSEVNIEIAKSESLCKSPSVSSESKPDPNNSGVSAEVSNFEVTDGTQVSDPPISIATDTKTEAEAQPVRRRQWGSRSIASTPSLSSESLEKLIPTSCWIRSKSTVIDNENDEVSRTSPVSIQDTVSHIDESNEKCEPFSDDIDENAKEENNEFDHRIKNKLFTDHKNNHNINEEDSSDNRIKDNSNNNNSDRLHLERELELEVDAVVENMDTYDDNNNPIEEISVAYDSRTVHLSSSDISPKLDVIIKRGCVVNTASTTTTTLNITPTPPITIAAMTTGINVNYPTITQSTNQMTTKIGEGLQSNSCHLTQTKKSPPPKRKGPKETKAVGYLVEPPERIEPIQPAKHPQTDIVYIRFLVRPFTAEQLRQMVVTHFGPVVDLWLDKIKSSSLIRLQTVEYAAKCRDGLDGSRWPSMNPRVLRCDYASTDLFEWMKVNGDSSDLQPPKHLLLGDASSNTEISIVEADKSDNGFTTSTDQEKKPTDLRRKLERSNRDIEQPLSVTKSLQGENKESPIAEAKPKSEEPAKLLNNLFRKTIATPSVYWLPLTPEQVNRRIKKSVAEKSDAKKTTSRHSSHPSEEPVQKATRSPFANSSSSSASPPSYPSSCIPNQSRRNPTTDRSSRPKIPDAKLSSNFKSSGDIVRHNSTKKPVSGNVLYDSKRSTSESKPKSTRDSKGESRDIVADDNKQQGRLSKQDTTSNNPTLSKIDKPSDNSRKKELSPSTHTRKRRYSKTDSDDKEAIPSKQSRPSLTSSGDSSVVGEALAAYKKNHMGTQHHRSEHRRRSSSNRHSSPNRRSSFKNSFPEGSRVKNKTDSMSHSRDSGRRRSRSLNQRHRSRSTERRDRSSSNRYRSRR